MSNHVHLAVRTTKRNLSAFMGYFKARVADAVHQITGRRGPLWARRFDAQPILNEEALMDRVAYTLDNPGKAMLVSDSRDWPGLNVAYGLDEADTFEFEYFDRTAWHRAKRPEDRERFWRTTTLRLSPIPCAWDASREQLGAALRSAQGTVDRAAGVAKRKRTTLSDTFVAGYTTDVLAQLDSGALLAELMPAQRIVFFCVEREPQACHRSLLVAKLARDLDLRVEDLGPE